MEPDRVKHWYGESFTQLPDVSQKQVGAIIGACVADAAARPVDGLHPILVAAALSETGSDDVAFLPSRAVDAVIDKAAAALGDSGFLDNAFASHINGMTTDGTPSRLSEVEQDRMAHHQRAIVEEAVREAKSRRGVLEHHSLSCEAMQAVLVACAPTQGHLDAPVVAKHVDAVLHTLPKRTITESVAASPLGSESALLHHIAGTDGSSDSDASTPSAPYDVMRRVVEYQSFIAAVSDALPSADFVDAAIEAAIATSDVTLPTAVLNLVRDEAALHHGGVAKTSAFAPGFVEPGSSFGFASTFVQSASLIRGSTIDALVGIPLLTLYPWGSDADVKAHVECFAPVMPSSVAAERSYNRCLIAHHANQSAATNGTANPQPAQESLTGSEVMSMHAQLSLAQRRQLFAQQCALEATANATQSTGLSLCGVVLRAQQTNPDPVKNAGFYATHGTEPAFSAFGAPHVAPSTFVTEAIAALKEDAAAAKSATGPAAAVNLFAPGVVSPPPALSAALVSTATCLPEAREAMLIARQSKTFGQAVRQAIRRGGPRASQRAMLVGAIVGARDGVRKIPQEWLAAAKGSEPVCAQAVQMAQWSFNPSR